MAEKQELNDVGGWLLFFIITLVIFSPLFNLYTLFTQIEFLAFTDIIESLAITSLFIIAGVFLWTKKPYAVKFAKVFLITQFIINIASSFIFSDFSSVGQYFVYFVIWILFLYNSKRVKQVYGNLKEKSSGMQIWPILAIIYTFIAPIFGAVFAVIALINISKNRKLKGLALSIVALILSILYVAVLFGYGALMGTSFDYVPEDIEIECSDYCYNVDSATQYFMEYSTAENGFMCYCLDDSSEIVEQKVYPYTLE